MFKIRLSYLFFILMLIFASCAKRGSITGGLKDTIAPVLRISSPENFSTNFNVKEIRLTFDEYIKIKDVNKQLIVSPPMKYAPVISPTNASKYISIRIKDTLEPNTTYSFNFGSSIQDNNEGNPYQQFKYVFSTGTYIDSLSLAGFIKDAYTKDVENFVSVMLYEVNDKFNDSIIYKEKPRYITNTLDSLKTFKLENLKAGKYLLVAMKDYNNNFKFDPKKDKIAFHQQFVQVPNDTLYDLELFNEIVPFKTTKPVQASANRIIVPYEGDPKNAMMTLKNGNDIVPIKVTKFTDKDSVQVWFKPLKADSLSLAIKKDKFEKEFSVRYKNQKKDSLNFNAKAGSINFRDKFTIKPTNPLVSIDTTKIKLTKKDSSAVAFKTNYDEFNQELKFDFEKLPLEAYNFQILPGAFTDMMDQVNDTLSYKLTTQNYSDFANMRVTLKNVKRFPVIVQLTNEKGDLLASEYSEGNTLINFDALPPGKFILRLIYDDNKNKIWDTGSYLEKRQPEEVIYYKDPATKDLLDIKTNWEVEQLFDLSQ